MSTADPFGTTVIGGVTFNLVPTYPEGQVNVPEQIVPQAMADYTQRLLDENTKLRVQLAAQDATILQLQAQILQGQQLVPPLQQQIADLTTTINALQLQIAQWQQEVTLLQQNVAALNVTIQSDTAQIADLQALVTQLQQDEAQEPSF